MKIVIECLRGIHKMKINLNGEDSKIVKQNETYTLIDNTNLNG